jgi:hypothetical protein
MPERPFDPERGLTDEEKQKLDEGYKLEVGPKVEDDDIEPINPEKPPEFVTKQEREHDELARDIKEANKRSAATAELQAALKAQRERTTTPESAAVDAVVAKVEAEQQAALEQEILASAEEPEETVEKPKKKRGLLDKLLGRNKPPEAQPPAA